MTMYSSSERKSLWILRPPKIITNSSFQIYSDVRKTTKSKFWETKKLLEVIVNRTQELLKSLARGQFAAFLFSHPEWHLRLIFYIQKFSSIFNNLFMCLIIQKNLFDIILWNLNHFLFVLKNDPLMTPEFWTYNLKLLQILRKTKKIPK